MNVGIEENSNRGWKIFTGCASVECQKKLREARKKYSEKCMAVFAGHKLTLGGYATIFLDDARRRLSPQSAHLLQVERLSTVGIDAPQD